MEPEAEERSICCSHTAQGHGCTAAHRNCPESFPAVQHTAAWCASSYTPAHTTETSATLGENKGKKHFQRCCECIYSNVPTTMQLDALSKHFDWQKTQNYGLENHCIQPLYSSTGTQSGMGSGLTEAHSEHLSIPWCSLLHTK